ncbi:MAG: hypothetical protein JXR48_00835 [Candidatus Delongbacteria bacterium]|nr:hypothetical protein [Candidatus Delongbacteria bacterium]MBN2833488.1 hypothetical protein [Candidatus Delongbacteria bacterium]
MNNQNSRSFTFYLKTTLLTLFFVLIFFNCASLKSSNYKSRIEAVKGIEDQKVLYKVAMEDENTEVKLAALEKINDQDLFYRIANQSRDTKVSLKALSRLIDQDRIFQIITDSKRSKFNQYALEVINDQNTLLRLAIYHEDFNLRKSAFEKLNDVDLIRNFAFSSEDLDLGCSAVSKISSQSDLMEIIDKNRVLEVKFAALEKLTDKEMINSLVADTNDTKIRIKAISKVFDSDILFNLILNDTRYTIVDASLKQLNDDQILELLKLQNLDNKLRLQIIGNLKDQNELMKLLRSQNDLSVKQEIFKKLDHDALENLSNDKNDTAMALAAKVKLGKISWDDVFAGKAGSMSDIIGASAIVQNPQPTPDAVVKACHKFIKKGDNSRIPELIFLLNKYGDKPLAEDYLNCGKRELYEAAAEWAKQHGFNVGSGYGSNRVRWGQGR